MVIPAKLNKNGGTAPVEIFATLLKIKVKIKDVNRGSIRYQRGPNTVCLYIVTISRFTKSSNKSL